MWREEMKQEVKKVSFKEFLVMSSLIFVVILIIIRIKPTFLFQYPSAKVIDENASMNIITFENYIEKITITLLGVIILNILFILYAIKNHKKVIGTEDKDCIMAKSNGDWSYSDIEGELEEAFYKICEGYNKRDISVMKDNLSNNMYTYYNNKINELIEDRMINVRDRIRLFQSRPVGVFSYTEEIKDFLWFYIESTMQDYKIDEITKEVVDNKKEKILIQQYWKMILVDGKWVLDKIIKKDDIKEIEFYPKYNME